MIASEMGVAGDVAILKDIASEMSVIGNDAN